VSLTKAFLLFPFSDLFISFKMPCSSVLSAAVSAKLNARIKELLEDGLSDSEIIRAIRREARQTKAWPELAYTRIKKMIDAAMDDEETASAASAASASTESSAPTFESDEEDEEYVPEEESDDETVTLVPEDSDEESEEAEESEESEESEEEYENVKEVVNAYIFFDHHDGSMDRITIAPSDEGLFQVEMAYDVASSYAFPRRANFFEGDADAVYFYIRDILQLVKLDAEPFKALEIALPFFPNVSMKPKALKKNARKLVLRALCQFLEHRFD
jgi:hypothetical protein